MSDSDSLLISGTSRFSEEVAEWVDETPGLVMTGFIENLDPDRCRAPLLGRPVHWVDALPALAARRRLLCGLGTTRRRRYIKQVAPLPFATLVHPTAHVAPSVGHHARIGRYATIGLGARIAGGCVIEEGAYVAMGANLLDQMRIGAGALVSAGALVTHDVPAHAQVIGMPAQVVRQDVDGH